MNDGQLAHPWDDAKLAELEVVARRQRDVAHLEANWFSLEDDAQHPANKLGTVPAKIAGTDEDLEGVKLWPYLHHAEQAIDSKWLFVYTVAAPCERRGWDEPMRRLTIHYRVPGQVRQADLELSKELAFNGGIQALTASWLPFRVGTNLAVGVRAGDLVPVKNHATRQVVGFTPITWTIMCALNSHALPKHTEVRSELLKPDGTHVRPRIEEVDLDEARRRRADAKKKKEARRGDG